MPNGYVQESANYLSYHHSQDQKEWYTLYL